MNKRQKSVLIVAAIVIVLMLLFPPMTRHYRASNQSARGGGSSSESWTFQGYHFIATTSFSIDTERLLLQYLAVALATTALYFVFSAKIESESKENLDGAGKSQEVRND